MCAGYLRNMGTLRESLKAALMVATASPAIRQHLIRHLDLPWALPSRTTLQRHRLTMHMGLLRWQQEEVRDMLQFGLIRWCMADSSPQGAWDFVVHGGRCMRSSNLLPAFDDINSLCCHEVSNDAKHAATERLHAVLCQRQYGICTVGSGKQSLIRKVHAICHATRLSSPSWKDAVSVLNSTASWTTDQGTESLLTEVRMGLRQLMGSWPEREDLAQRSSGSGDESDGEFDFVHEP